MRKNTNVDPVVRTPRPSTSSSSWRDALWASHVLCGGRVTKWKGTAASYAPHVAELFCCAGRLLGARVLPLAVLAGLAASPARALDLYWDPNSENTGQGGDGTWNLNDTFWNSDDDGVTGPFRAWDNGAPDNAIFAGTAGTVTLGDPITAGSLTFDTNAYTLTGGTLTLGGAAPMITVTTGTSTIASSIAGSAGLTKDGAGILYLSGVNSFTGLITVNSGTLRASDTQALGDLSNDIATTADVTLQIDSGTTDRTVTIGSGTTVTVKGAGAGSLLLEGDGNVSILSNVRLTKDNTYTGTTTLTGAYQGAGNIYFSSVRNIGEASSLGAPQTEADGTITFTGGSQYRDSITYTGDGDSSNRNWIFGGGPARRFFNSGSGTLTLSGDIDILVDTSFEATSAGFDLQGEIGTSSAATPTVLFLAGATAPIIVSGGTNSYAGNTVIGGGSVSASVLADGNANSSLGAGTAISLISNGILNYTGTGDSSNRTWTSSDATGISNSGNGALSLSGNLSFDPANLTSNSLSLGGSYTGVNTFSGVISGNGDLLSTGSSIWQLDGDNTRTGTITVEGGTLRAGSASAFGTTTDVTVNGGTLDLNNFNLDAVLLSGDGGSINLGSATLSVTPAAGMDSTYAGAITGTGNLSKQGAGTLTLTGQNTYTGETAIGGGTLVLDFAAAGAPADNILSPDSTLSMAGGAVVLNGSGTNNQRFAGLDITAGSNEISISNAAANVTVDLGTVTRSSGLIDFGFSENSAFATSSTELGGWATVNGTDYAKVEGGLIVPLTEDDYADKDNATNWETGDIVTDVDGFTGEVDDSVLLGGLRYTQPVATDVTIANGQTLAIDGSIIVAPTVEDFDQSLTNGSLTSAPGESTLGVIQNSEGNFEIGSTIVNGGPDSTTDITSFTKSGSGMLTLSGNNSYTGVTTLSGGTLSVSSIGNGGANSNIGASDAAPENLVLESGVLSYTGGSAITDRGFTLKNGGPSRTIEVADSAANLEFQGLVVSPDDAGFTKAGPGTLTLANTANTYAGVTEISDGTLSVTALANGGENSSIGTSSNDPSNLVFSDGGTLQYTGGTVTSDRGMTLDSGGGAVDVATTGMTLTLSGTAIGEGSLTKKGGGTLILSGTNTYTGGTVVDEGVLQVGSNQPFGPVATNSATPMTVNAGGTLDLATFDTVVGPLNGDGNIVLNDATLDIRGGDGTFSGILSGTGGLTHSVSGTQTLTGCGNSYEGPTTIDSSTLAVDCLADGEENSSIGASGSDPGNLVFAGGRLTYTGDDASIDRGFTLQNGTNYIDVADAAATLEFSGEVIGGGRLRKEGAGTLVLSGTNTYTGGDTIVDGGTLRAGVENAFGTSTAAGAIGLANTAGATLDLGSFNTAAYYLNGGGANGGNIILNGATLTIRNGNSSSSVIYSGTIEGTGDLIKNGGAIQRLHGCDSSFTGVVTINAGSIEVACLTDGDTNSSIGASSADAGNIVLNGGALRYVGAGDSTNREFTLGTAGGGLDASGTGAINYTSTAAITLAGTDTARTLTLSGTSSADNTLAALIEDNGAGATSLTKTDTGTWVLTNPGSTYTGVTTILGGVLAVDKLANGGEVSSIGSSLKDAGNLVIGQNSTLRYTGSGDTTDRLFTLETGVTYIESSGSGAIVFENTAPVTLSGTGNRTIALGGTNEDDNILGGTIADGTGGVTTLAKNGPGTWVLTGENTYSGNTVINDGNLVIGDGGGTGNAGTGNVIVDSASSTLSLNRNDTFNFSGSISGPGTLAQIGSGTSVLTSAANEIGAARVDQGTLQIGGGTTAGNLITATVALNNDSTLIVAADSIMGAASGGTATFTGDTGDSTIDINADGTLRAAGDLGDGADTVTLAGTLNTGTGVLGLGAGDDTLTLNDGGVLTGSVYGGAGTGDTLEVVNAAARTLTSAEVNEFEKLIKQDTGTLTLTGDHNYTAGTEIQAGTLQIGAGGTSGSLTGDVLDNGALAFNRSDALTITGLISGSGTVSQIGDGTTILAGDNSYDGATTVQSGKLVINGDQSLATETTTVANGAALGGSGKIGGDVTVQAGGTLAPGNSPGTLTVNGNLSLDAGSLLDFEFGAANVEGGPLNDLIAVGGDLILDGTINVAVSDTGSFDAGVYRVFTYEGDLTDNELELGTMPTGSTVAVQTSVDKQVNLINTAGLSLNYWDGDSGPENDGTVNGGDGTWRAGSDSNWTDSEGTANGTYAADSFAIFQGTGGTVTVDAAGVSASGMQFAVDGYTVENSTITLTGTQSTIRVGVGSVGADYVATISSVLAGGSELVKSDIGTLVLSGANTYTGGTRIQGGTLQVSGNGNLGLTTSGLTFDGGTLHTTASFTSNRLVTLEDGGGGFLTDAATTLTLTTGVGGDGALVKSGDGTLLLTADNSYGGGTTISAGTLQIGDGGTSGAITSDVVNNGMLVFDRADALSYDGAITGTGNLNQVGDGTLTLTGNSNYSGDTTIEAGGLRLDSGGSIIGSAHTSLTGADVTATVSGTDSLLETGLLDVGLGVGSTGTLTIEDGGIVRTTGGDAEVGGLQADSGTVNVAGAGSLLDVAGALRVGTGTGATSGVLDITDGATVQSDSGYVGSSSGNTGTKSVSIEGSGSNWTISNDLEFYHGSVSVSDGGALNAGTVSMAGTDGTAILNIGGAEGSAATGAGTLDAAALTFGPGTGRLNFNHTETDYTFATPMSGAGEINQVAGTTILTGDSSAFNGTTTVSGGALLVNGTLGDSTSALDVLAGGTLGGIGTIGGPVDVADGGTVAPGDIGTPPGTLTIAGPLTLGDVNLAYNFGQANVEGGPFNDLIRVGGDLVLDGTLNVTETAGGDFSPGLYRIMGYEGTLSDQTLELGTMPAGTFYVQTSVDKQVNLINSTGVTLSFWDGPDGTSNDGDIHGGSGTWRLADNEYWTDQTGNANAPYANGTFAIFTGAAGTVSVDNSEGQVQVGGMQFAVNGYTVDGQPLELVGAPDTLIRVGDGTEDGTAMTATVAADISGDSRLVKTDLGTLVLSGSNSYTGGTRIEDGTLEISADENLGAAAGTLEIDGATLRTTATMETGRAVSLANTGTFETVDGTTLTLNGGLDGPGNLTKMGGGELVLGSASSYGGDTTVAEGALIAASAGAFSASSDFSVLENGTLDLAGQDQTVASLSNAGTVHLSSTPGTTLTVTGDYTGDGGTIVLNTVLGGDTSATDRVVVGGSTSGSTTLRVNPAGGDGAQTRNGIKLVDVAGASNGTFALDGDYTFQGQPAVVGGAYSYRLYKNGVDDPADGDWYLRSELTEPPTEPEGPGTGNPTDPGTGPQGPGEETPPPLYQPGVPLYEAYAGVLQSFNSLETLRQRVGGRAWRGNQDGNGLWARMEAGHRNLDPKFSTSGTDYDVDRWQFQAGADAQVKESDSGRLVAGLSGRYGTLSSDVSSVYGAGKIKTHGYGMRGTLTWYGANGFYVDGQADATWYESDLLSYTAKTSLAEDNNAFGYGVSAEVGQRVALDEHWGLTPQVQWSYSDVDFDDFTDTFDAEISLERGRSIQSRIGLAADFTNEWTDARGELSRAHAYGIANLYYDFADGTRAAVSGTRFRSEVDELWGGLGYGFAYNWSDDRYSIYAEVSADTSLANFGDNYSIKTNTGLRIRW